MESQDKFTFTFNEMDVYTINQALQQLPYGQVSQLIPKFHTQVEAQKDKFSAPEEDKE